MSISTYAELNTAVVNWLARDDLTSRIPEFIALAEAKFNRSLRCRQMEIRSTTTLDTSSDEPQMMSMPTDFQSMRSFKITNFTGQPRLEYMSDAQMDEYRLAIGNTSSRPRYFSIFGSEIELAPTPDSNYVLEMKYRATIPALTASNTTNWLLTLAPDIYLYGTLLESAPYIKEDARIQTWGAGMTAALDGLNSLSQESGYGSGPLVARVSGVTP
jgi:hypothetical protein